MRSFALLLTAALLLLTGCRASRDLDDLAQQRSESIDGLRDEIDVLRARIEVLQDSLHFYDDIHTGRYYRRLRLLNARMTRMHYDLAVLRDGGRPLATIGADQLFKPASAILTSAGMTRLDTLAAHLRQTDPDRPIRVEGHSDNLPLSPKLKKQYPSNWELSAARASTVVRYLVDVHAFPADRFLIVAYGATQPLASNETAAGRRRNRRVHIAVLPEPHDYARLNTAW